VLVGGAIAAILAPMMACVTGWFDTRVSLAVSLVSAGMGIAPMTMAPIVAWLVSGHDWRTTLQIVALIVAAIMIPVSLLVRRPPGLATAIAAAPASGGPQADMSIGEAVRSPQFIILLLTQFLLLRHPFRADHPHRQLCRQLRHSADRGGFDLQPRRVCRARRPHRIRPAWR